MGNFLNSKWFLIVKAGLLALVMFFTQQEIQAEGQKSRNEPVTAVDLPASVTPALAILYGLAQSGQEKKIP